VSLQTSRLKVFQSFCIHCCRHLQDEFYGRKKWTDVTYSERKCWGAVQWEFVRLVKKRARGEKVKPHFALFVLVSMAEVVLVLTTSMASMMMRGSVDVSKASVLSKSGLSLSSATTCLCFSSLMSDIF
jgi:hypothetical protein